MALSLIRGKYVICKIRSRTAADVIEDGAVVQRDGTILAVGPYAALAQGVRADPRRVHQQAGWQQSSMGWADAVGGKGRLIFLSSQTSRGSPVSPGSSGLRATFLLRFRRVVALQVGGSMAKRKNTSILVLVSAPRPGCARGRSALQSALEQGRERRRAISLGLDTP